MALNKDLESIAQAYLSVVEKKMDKVNPKALKKDFDDRKDKDIDNDGDVDDSDEYLHNRRKTVSKNIDKNEDRRQFTAAVMAAKKAGDKEFVFAGKKYQVQDEVQKIKSEMKKMEAVDVEVDDKSDATADPASNTPKEDPKNKKKKKDDPKVTQTKDDDEEAPVKEATISPAGDSPAAKERAKKDQEFVDKHNIEVKDYPGKDKQDSSDKVKASPARPGDSSVGEKQMKKFKEMR